MPFEPGKSGNPSGRPKGTGKKQAVSAVFQEYLEGEVEGQTRLQALLNRLYVDDPKTMLAYAYGKPVETQVVQNPDGSSLYTEVVLAMAQAHERGAVKLPATKPQ